MVSGPRPTGHVSLRPTNRGRFFPGRPGAHRGHDQYTDSANLSYLSARYYNPAQGQFLSEDPVFLGNPNQQNLADRQSVNQTGRRWVGRALQIGSSVAVIALGAWQLLHRLAF